MDDMDSMDDMDAGRRNTEKAFLTTKNTKGTKKESLKKSQGVFALHANTT